MLLYEKLSDNFLQELLRHVRNTNVTQEMGSVTNIHPLGAKNMPLHPNNPQRNFNSSGKK